jgi:hypothetical protein
MRATHVAVRDFLWTLFVQIRTPGSRNCPRDEVAGVIAPSTNQAYYLA